MCNAIVAEIKYLPTGKKYPVMVIQKHVYKRVKQNSSGKVFWRCVLIHRTGCKAYCLVDDDEIDLGNEHNHDPPKCRTKTGRWQIPNLKKNN